MDKIQTDLRDSILDDKWSAIKKAIGEVFELADLTPIQNQVIRLAWGVGDVDADPMSVSEISKKIGRNQSSVRRALMYANNKVLRTLITNQAIKQAIEQAIGPVPESIEPYILHLNLLLG